MAKLSSVS